MIASRSSFARLRASRIGATRAALRFLSHVAIVGGALLILDAGLTVVWQEPVSAFFASRAQAELRDDLDAYGDRFGASLSDAALRLGRRTESGEALGEIEIPSIDVSFVIVEGTGTGDLRKGPGHYEQTQLPGERGTFGVAGHRTTYLAPFRDIDKLEPSDRIEVRMPYGRFVYEVEGSKVVDRGRTSVLDPAERDRLVLTACHPLYSAAQRIVVVARLTGSPPRPLGSGGHSSDET